MPPTIFIYMYSKKTLSKSHQQLESDGYTVITSESLSQLLQQLQHQIPNLFIIDGTHEPTMVMQTCRDIRQLTVAHTLPILVLIDKAARAEQAAEFLDAGADDVLRMPFAKEELNARIRALLRWQQPNLSTKSRFHLTLNPNQHRVIVNDHSILLTPIEFQLLDFLCQHQGDYHSARDLLVEVWKQSEDSGDTALVRNHIRNIRRKLEKDPDHPNILISRYGQGYNIEAEIRYDSA